MFVNRIASFTLGSLALTALLAVATPSHAQDQDEQGWPINHPEGSSSFPWNSPEYSGYYEPQYVAQPIVPSAPMVEPQKYQAKVNALPMSNTKDPNAITIVAHVPENAQVWIEDKPMTSTGKLRTFQSPSLTPGKTYHYTVRVAWIEDGKVVSQTRSFPVKTGDVHAVYLTKAKS